MNVEESCRDIAERALRHGKSLSMEVLVEYEDRALTRFANNGIHQNVAEENTVVSVRVIDGGRSSRATSNGNDDASLKAVVEKASEAVKFMPSSVLPEEVLKSAEYGHIQRRCVGKAELGSSERAECVGAAIRVAKSRGLSSAGFCQSRRSVTGFGNSSGLYVSHLQDEAEFSVTMDTGESTGWTSFVCPSADELDAAADAEIAADKAVEGRGAVGVEPG